MLRELYQEMIIDHGKKPRNFGALPEANHQQIGHNPLCGDKMVLYVLLKDNKIEKIRFSGQGCAISMASASLMTEAAKEQTVDYCKMLIEAFQNLLIKGQAPKVDLGKLQVLSGVAEFPARVKCATLAWHTLEAVLRNDQAIISTE